MTKPTNLLVLAFDGLGASALGCYGSSWAPTPGFDRLASESTVYDFAFVGSSQVASTYRAWLGATADLELAPPRFTLLSDDAGTCEWDSHFADVQLLDPPPRQRAETLGETHLAQLLAQTTEAASELAEPWSLWLHARALAGPWDAPIELRAALSDEEDDVPPARWLDPPHVRLAEDFDPDERWQAITAYAAQAQVVDAAVDALLDALTDLGILERTTVVVTSPRGFPVAARRHFGWVDDSLYEETAHVPLIVRRPGGESGLQRVHRIVGPQPWRSALAGQAASRSEPNYVIGSSRDSLWLRTPAWLARLPRGDDPAPAELYVKPDDRWEVNDVAMRAPQIVETAQAFVLARLAAASHQPPTPPEELMRPNR